LPAQDLVLEVTVPVLEMMVPVLGAKALAVWVVQEMRDWKCRRSTQDWVACRQSRKIAHNALSWP
jgi:hypothetical protein